MRVTRRQGATLVELLVALVLFSVVGGATLRALDRQARLHSGIMTILESRAQHAATHEALAVELRSASAPSGDIGSLTDSSVTFRLAAGSGVACALSSGSIDLAPDSVAAGQRLARFRATPQPGDTAWVLDESATTATADDRWVSLEVRSATRVTGRCVASALVDSVRDAGRPGWRLVVSGTVPATALPGSIVRVTRWARFALYRGGTGEHWLGYSERQSPGGGWITIQPVSGPYLPYRAARPAAGGIALAGRDSSGGAIAGGVAAAALSLATRSLTTRTVRIDGLSRGRHADSLHSIIGLRNTR